MPSHIFTETYSSLSSPQNLLPVFIQFPRRSGQQILLGDKVIIKGERPGQLFHTQTHILDTGFNLA